MELIVEATGVLRCGGARYRCALGRTGVRRDKREGDGATPLGSFALRRLFYRPDRLAPPPTALPLSAIDPALGWCDDPACADYNRLVALPHRGSHERLWRDDALYDIVVSIGYNDDPVSAGAGSAIFLHVAAPDYAPTQGCVALAPDDLRAVVAACGPAGTIRIGAEDRDA